MTKFLSINISNSLSNQGTNKVAKLLSGLITFTLLATFPMLTSAHELKETSARITLRDGQVEVRITTDIKRWQTRLQDNRAWLLGDIEQVMPQGLSQQKHSAFLQKVMQNKTAISINNKPITFDSVSITKPTEKNHGHFGEIVLTAKHSNSSVDNFNIQFPKSLGAVHASFVKPQYKMIPPGNSTQVSFASPAPKKIAAAHQSDHDHQHH